MNQHRHTPVSKPLAGPDFRSGLTAKQKHELWHHMRVPVVTFVALMLLLCTNLVLGWFHLFPNAWIVELPILLCMVATVLLFSMEIIEDPPLTRLFSVIGFCWVGILFAMTMIDYLTR